MELPSGKPINEDDSNDYSSLDKDELNVEDIIKDIKNIIKNHDDPSDKICKFINTVEEKIEKQEIINREYIRSLILKHPFFKNPNNYHIRLITIMKYLRKKGIDVRIKDIDLVVDEIIMTIEGVKKHGQDRYALKK